MKYVRDDLKLVFEDIDINLFILKKKNLQGDGSLAAVLLDVKLSLLEL